MSDFFYIFIAIALVYFFAVFVLLRLVAPFMGFKKHGLPAKLPLEMEKVVLDLESKSNDQKSYLKAVYNLVLEKTVHQWGHTRFKAATQFSKLFLNDLSKIWNLQSFCYCQAINFSAYALIARSKFFNAEDVKIKVVFLNFVPHQYLQVRAGGKWVDFDPAGSGIRGKGLGTHASLFG